MAPRRMVRNAVPVVAPVEVRAMISSGAGRGSGGRVAYVLAALGGALGALARWAVVLALPPSSGDWPWATLTVNLVGCLLIGVLLAVLSARRPDDEHLRTFLGAGVLGGFTTFSAFAVEVADLLRAGLPVVAAGYVATSVLGGLLAVAVGLRLGATAARSRP